MIKKSIPILAIMLMISGCSLINDGTKDNLKEDESMTYSQWIKETNIEEDFKTLDTSSYKKESFYYVKPTIDTLESILGDKRLLIKDDIFKESNPNLYFCENRETDSMSIMPVEGVDFFNGYISLEELEQFANTVKGNIIKTESNLLEKIFLGVEESSLPYKNFNYKIELEKDFYLIKIEADTTWNMLVSKNYSEFTDPDNIDFSEIPTNDFFPFKIEIVLKDKCPAAPIEK